MIQNVLIFNPKTNYQIDLTLYVPEGGFDKVVILCHGFGSHKERPAITITAQKLLENKIAAVTFNFSQHGDGAVLNKKLSVQNCVADILCVADYVKKELGIERSSLFGVSFGAYVVLNTLKGYADNFDKIILRSPAIDMKSILIKLLDMTVSEYQSVGVAKFGYMKRIEVPFSFYLDLCQNDLTASLEDFPAKKMLIIQGEADEVADISDTCSFVERYGSPLVQLIKMPNTQHSMSVQEVELVADYAIDYLQL